jgi:2-polyprenyl-3-methyl-5-hydroxy-6-metoxy-1,4-benzoquinol methylase
MTKNYLEINKALWESRTAVHIKSEFYDHDGFKKGRSSINEVELGLLGDLKGKSVIHLQCHFGQDTLSMARMGAKATGIDLSEEAMQIAQETNAELGLEARFICANVYDIVEELIGTADMVFSSFGAICWLPDMTHWAKVIAAYLKPGGHFVFAEFHPALWMFDDSFKELKYSYFNREEIVEMENGTYTDAAADIHMESVTWNHDLGEVLQALLSDGLDLRFFQEYDYSPYNCFQNTVESSPGKYQIRSMEGKLPMMYALKMQKADR